MKITLKGLKELIKESIQSLWELDVIDDTISDYSNIDDVTFRLSSIFNEEKKIKLDYIAIVNEYGFREVDLLEDGNEYYILVAARVGNTRLIDNELVRLQ